MNKKITQIQHASVDHNWTMIVQHSARALGKNVWQ